MAFVSGTATDAENLFSIFRTFITSNASLAAESPTQVWVEEEYNSFVDGNGNNRYELFLRGPGLAGTDNVHVNLELFKDISAGSDAWTIICHGATSYNSALTITQQPGWLSNPKYMPIWDQAIPYWFFANGRRFIMIAQITASVYVNLYCGFILPFSPSVSALEYTYPLYIGASMFQTGFRFSDTNGTRHRSFWNPGNSSNTVGSSAIYTPSNDWLELINVSTGGGKLSSFPQTLGGIEPYVGYSFLGSSGAVSSIENWQPLIGGDFLLMDCTVTRPNTNPDLSERFGVLDGACWITGVGQSSQNTVSVGSDTYTVFQEGFRTGTGDFVAIKQ